MLMTQGGRAAKLHYMANGFRILAHGDHVTCAVSGAAIQLEHLRYWSVELQEAYATPELATKAALGQ
ncbi:MAG: DUF2093 domain-containing protein [Pseudomonadota bacterium]